MTRLSINERNVMMKLENFLSQHFQEVSNKIIEEFKIDKEKWGELLHNYMVTAVNNIKPSSRLLRDSIDINKYIKIFLLDNKD